MSRRLVLSLSVVTLAAAAVAPALAAPKPKPRTMSGSYTAEAAVPDPSPFVTSQTGEGGPCEPTLDQAKHEKAITLPAAGSLKIDLNGFQGDWALALLNSKGQVLQASDQDITQPLDTPEKITQKIKSKGKYVIRACNFSGGPTANVKWTFNYVQ